jgi:hypothetical protein
VLTVRLEFEGEARLFGAQLGDCLTEPTPNETLVSLHLFILKNSLSTRHIPTKHISNLLYIPINDDLALLGRKSSFKHGKVVQSVLGVRLSNLLRLLEVACTRSPFGGVDEVTRGEGGVGCELEALR